MVFLRSLNLGDRPSTGRSSQRRVPGFRIDNVIQVLATEYRTRKTQQRQIQGQSRSPSPTSIRTQFHPARLTKFYRFYYRPPSLHREFSPRSCPASETPARLCHTKLTHTCMQGAHSRLQSTYIKPSHSSVEPSLSARIFHRMQNSSGSSLMWEQVGRWNAKTSFLPGQDSDGSRTQ